MKIIDGSGLSTAAAPVVVQPRGYRQIVQNTDLAVGVAAVIVGTPAAAPAVTLIDVQNLSPAGTVIRLGVGVVPVFATTGKVLNPGDNFSVAVAANLGGTGNIQAIASAANGVLGRNLLAT